MSHCKSLAVHCAHTFVLLASLILPGIEALAQSPGTLATTPPVSPEQAAFAAQTQIVDLLLDELPDEELLRGARYARGQGDHARAAIYGLTALRGHPSDPLTEFEVSCNFAQWGQKPLAMRYLNRAADHGYWGYRTIVDDTDLNAIKGDVAFPAALAKVKTSFEREAPKHPPGQTTEFPKQGAQPAAGWPVMVSLHGWGSSRHDFDDSAAFVATLGYVGISLDANEVMGPGAYTWTNESAAKTHERVQAALAKTGVKIDGARVYLHGFSQGAMHAACLLAEHPNLYAGAIVNSPGPPKLLPKALADPEKTGGIVLSIGDREHPDTGASVDKLAALWNGAKRPVHVIRFKGGHQLPPDEQAMFRDSLERLRGRK